MPITLPAELLQHKLAPALRHQTGVRLIYLFGSQVEGDTGPMSDYDFAVLVDPSVDRRRVAVTLAHELSRVLGTADVDVVLLNRAPVELAYAVITQGRLLFELDTATRIEYEAGVLSRYADYLPVLRAQREDILEGGEHVHRVQRYRTALGRTSVRLARLQPLTDKTRGDFEGDPYLRDIVERNLEIAAQCCLDIAHRIISLERARKPVDYYDAILRMGELGVLPPEFALRLAPLAGFRNILVHQYLPVEWDEVYRNLHHLDDLERFAELVRVWMRERLADTGPGSATDATGPTLA